MFFVYATYFAFTTQKGTQIDTGACRSARTSKPLYCKITWRKITRPHLITKHPMTKKKLSTTPRTIWKPKTTLWKKGLYTTAWWNQLRCRQQGKSKFLGRPRRLVPGCKIAISVYSVILHTFKNTPLNPFLVFTKSSYSGTEAKHHVHSYQCFYYVL